MNSIERKLNMALKNANQQKSSTEAFKSFEKMAQYLDENFAPVKPDLQLALYPFIKKDKREQKEVAMELVKKFPATTNMFSDYQAAVWR